MDNAEQQIKSFIVQTVKLYLGNHAGKIQEITDQTKLVGDGLLDSLAFIELISAIEKEFKLKLSFNNLDPSEFSTLKGLADRVTKSTKKQ